MVAFAPGGPDAGSSPLQQAPGGTLPIDLTASPTKTLAYGTVKLSGSTGFTGAGSVVTLRITPPGTTTPVVLTAKVASDGRYSAVFAKTVQLGTYQVQAIAPDKKGQATASFRVVPVEVIPAEFGRTVDSLIAVTQQALGVVRQGVQGLPASPERAQAEQRLSDLDQRMAGVPAQTAILTQEMKKVFKARAQVPEDNPEWDGYLGRLDGWQSEASSRTVDLRSRMKAASAETQRCGKLDRYNELLAFAGETMSFATVPFDFTTGLWMQKIPPAFVPRAMDPQTSPQAKFVAIQTMKLGVAALKGPAGLLQAIPGMVLDATALVAQLAFSKYCQKLEGPVAATFLGESFTKQGEPFLNYTISLDGKLVLVYDRAASTGQPIGVIGYVEGTGRFRVADNPPLIARLTPGVVLFHRVYAPPPASFRVPLKGTLTGDSILLVVQPAVRDFSSEGHSVLVVMPAGGLVPQIIDSRFTLQKAFPILDRVIRRHPVLRMAYAGGTRALGTFARDTSSPDKTVRVRTQLQMQACNPSCAGTSPAQPKAKE